MPENRHALLVHLGLSPAFLLQLKDVLEKYRKIGLTFSLLISILYHDDIVKPCGATFFALSVDDIVINLMTSLMAKLR
jgi:hypothetical protein